VIAFVLCVPATLFITIGVITSISALVWVGWLMLLPMALNVFAAVVAYLTDPPNPR